MKTTQTLAVGYKNVITVRITSGHYHEASSFDSISHCPLAIALKDMFPILTPISVLTSTVIINNIVYEFDQRHWGGKLLTIEEINDRIKHRDAYETVTLKLTKRLVIKFNHHVEKNPVDVSESAIQN